MTIEEKLKEYILSYYKSIREFTQKADIPYSTMDGILKRGIGNSSIGNILKVCQALNISADELGNNRIVPITNSKSYIMLAEIPEMLSYIRKNKKEYKDLTIDGITLSDEEFEILFDVLDLSVDFIKRKRERN